MLNWEKVNQNELKSNNWAFRSQSVKDGLTVEIRLGEILEKVKLQKAIINPNQKYYELTVRTSGRGVERRIKNKQDYILGSEIKSSRYFAPANSLIVSKIDARNGSIGIIPKNLDNSLITNTFWLFHLKKHWSWINIVYVEKYLNAPNYWNYFEGLSCGTTNRRSLTLEDFLNTRIEVGDKHTKFKLYWEKKEELEEFVARKLSKFEQSLKRVFS